MISFLVSGWSLWWPSSSLASSRHDLFSHSHTHSVVSQLVYALPISFLIVYVLNVFKDDDDNKNIESLETQFLNQVKPKNQMAIAFSNTIKHANNEISIKVNKWPN
jgi:hypothetical protein